MTYFLSQPSSGEQGEKLMCDMTECCSNLIYSDRTRDFKVTRKEVFLENCYEWSETEVKISIK